MSVTVVRQSPPNARAAEENRRTFDELGIVCVNLVGSTGAGKTALLAAVLPLLKERLRVAVLEGDAASTCDAQRIAQLGIPTVQVLTDGQCHLSANQVQRGVLELPLHALDLLVIENIGGPLCPPRCDLGEHLRVAVLSVTGGHQVAAKYPGLIAGAGLVLLTKYDLLPHVDFDLAGTLEVLRRLSPSAEIICTGTRNRIGIDRAAGWLLGYVRAQRMRRPQRPPRLRTRQPALAVT